MSSDKTTSARSKLFGKAKPQTHPGAMAMSTASKNDELFSAGPGVSALLNSSCRHLMLALTVTFSTAAGAVSQAQGQALKSYNAAIDETSISGISSGAFMAVQFATAWSSVIKGVGVVAGGPFYCAQASAADFFNGYTRSHRHRTLHGGATARPAPDDRQG
jgi:hypothetical protein